jgi:hypothetical protein
MFGTSVVVLVGTFRTCAYLTMSFVLVRVGIRIAKRAICNLFPFILFPLPSAIAVRASDTFGFGGRTYGGADLFRKAIGNFIAA